MPILEGISVEPKTLALPLTAFGVATISCPTINRFELTQPVNRLIYQHIFTSSPAQTAGFNRYRPLNRAARFSMNALRPSKASSLRRISDCTSISR
jgi:hypothetical protein